MSIAKLSLIIFLGILSLVSSMAKGDFKEQWLFTDKKLDTGDQLLLVQEQKALREFIIAQWKLIDPQIQIRWDNETNLPVWISGNLSPRMDSDAKEIVTRFFKNKKDIFRITEPDKELTIVVVNKDAHGWKHVIVQQIYKSLPVEGKQILVHISPNKEIKVINGYYLPDLQLDTLPEIQGSKAISIATKAPPKKTVIQSPDDLQLVVYKFQDKTYLAWKVRIITQSPPGDFIYYVDAKTGNVIDSYNGLNSLK